MLKPSDPKELAVILLPRSICLVQVAAVLAYKDGIYSWGWNQMGATGMGLCAERHAILRTPKHKRYAMTVYVAGQYKDGRVVKAKPCSTCQKLIDKYMIDVVYRDRDGVWINM